jgi:hypothetical protein
MQEIIQNNQKLYQHPTFTEYACTLDGLVYSLKFNNVKLLKPFLNKGYLQIDINFNKKRLTKYVHQFVYECITQSIPIWGHDSDSNSLNHKDENKQNNSYSNLEKIPFRENVKLQERFKKQNKKSGLPLSVYCDKRNKIKTYFVQIYYEGKLRNFGTFETIQEAEEVAITKRKELFPND